MDWDAEDATYGVLGYECMICFVFHLSHFLSGNGVFWICGCGRFACLSPKMMPREQSFIFLSRFWIFGLRLCLRIGISHFPPCLHGNGRIRIKGVADLHAWMMPLVQSFLF
ncbi:MAG: hypothetical protein ACK559_33360 [bacterium]